MNETLSRPSRLLQCRLNSSVNFWLIRCILLTFSAGHVQTADSSLLSASAFSLPSLCIERAKWMASQVTRQISPFYQRWHSLHIPGLQSPPLLVFKKKREVHNTLSGQDTETLCCGICFSIVSAIDVLSNIRFASVFSQGDVHQALISLQRAVRSVRYRMLSCFCSKGSHLSLKSEWFFSKVKGKVKIVGIEPLCHPLSYSLQWTVAGWK